MTVEPAWVLVVDDDASDRLALFRLLEREGHHATVADSGRAALDLLRTEPFDLVLLDLRMPDLDGFGVVQAMTSDARLRTIPVIMISEANELETILRCIRHGAEDYLDKPIDPVLLRARVNASLTKKRLRDREDEYLDVVGHLIEAANAAGRDDFDPRSLDPVARRVDPLGQLARAVREMTTRAAGGRAPTEGTDPLNVPAEPGVQKRAKDGAEPTTG